MGKKYLYETLDALKDAGMLSDLPDIIEQNLSEHIVLRDYQIDAFKYFVSYYENDMLRKNKQVHNLFHMATGSGKTVIMAGLILYLYSKGYNNFLFFVNQTNILEKTKENFINKNSSKYLFADDISYLGNNVNIKVVDNFSTDPLNEDIQICFTTTQKLHMDLFIQKENSLTYEDFENNKTVFISDESHHVNTLTKKPTKIEEEAMRSWEYSVTNAFARNKDSILLEFTATADLKDSNVESKYLDKIIYNYPLSKFRESGYTKDFQNFATDSELWDRALMALIISEYRKYLFADNKLNMKPVIMLKSQFIKDSEDFYDLFFRKVKELTTDEIKGLYTTTNMEVLKDTLDYFKEKDNTFELLVHSLQNSFTKDKSIIMNGASEDNKENQLLVNSLEDKDNPIRVVFAVDMLNEGWDVLNLFDIVRLYDTRQSSGKAGEIGNYTIKEAQLIGRAARYCPFQVSEEQERFKRKYDYDLDNKFRLLETMYFHSRNDSRYISELKQALIQTGLQAESPIKLDYKIKDTIKESNFYKKAFVFSNKREPKGRQEVNSIESSMKNKTHRYIQRTIKGKIVGLLDDSTTSEVNKNTISYKFKDISYNILSGASERFKELRFNVIKSKYPNVRSLKEFLTSEDYLGNNIIEISFYSDELTGKDIQKACIKAFEQVANHIVSIKQEFNGSIEFQPRQLSKVIKDKSIHISKVEGNGGQGDSQNNCLNEDYRLDLSKENWYIFNDNYGTSEEKLFLKYFKTDIEPKLKDKNLEYYLVRNERVPELAIYTFKDGERIEPDFLLFVKKENTDNYTIHQIYAEAKGNHLLLEDSWKEDFLIEIEDKASVNAMFRYGNDYKIIGFPFFNDENRREQFNKAVNDWIEKI